jgi:hypothetical protein
VSQKVGPGRAIAEGVSVAEPEEKANEVSEEPHGESEAQKSEFLAAEDDDTLLDIFESETVDDPYLRNLASGLEKIDIFELLKQARDVSRQLKERAGVRR